MTPEAKRLDDALKVYQAAVDAAQRPLVAARADYYRGFSKTREEAHARRLEMAKAEREHQALVANAKARVRAAGFNGAL